MTEYEDILKALALADAWFDEKKKRTMQEVIEAQECYNKLREEKAKLEVREQLNLI